MKSFLPALLVLLMVPVAAAQETATYRVTFESTWSASTHPDDFPSNPHFSPLIGSTHHDGVIFWEAGGIATPGIESMAETGATSSLRSEVEAAIQAGMAGGVLAGGGIGASPGNVQLTFEITTAHPLVSLVSMLAPSPDWFVGVHGLPLYVEGEWLDRVEIDLYVYDAGTDSGETYTAANADTDPQTPIARIETTPFKVGDAVPPVGRYIFERITGVGVNDTPPETPGTHTFTPPSPNPFTHAAHFSLTLAQPQHVRVDLYDVRGRRLQQLFAGALAAGTPHRLAIDGADLPAGVYLVRIAATTFQDGSLVVRL